MRDPSRLRMRTAVAWKVPTQRAEARASPTAAAMRSRISRAARRARGSTARRSELGTETEVVAGPADLDEVGVPGGIELQDQERDRGADPDPESETDAGRGAGIGDLRHHQPAPAVHHLRQA